MPSVTTKGRQVGQCRCEGYEGSLLFAVCQNVNADPAPTRICEPTDNCRLAFANPNQCCGKS